MQGILEKETVAVSSLNPHVPARLDLLVRATLAKEPSARPTAAEAVSTLTELQKPRKGLLDSVAAAWKWAAAAILILVACFAGWRWKQARVAGYTATFRQITTLILKTGPPLRQSPPDWKLAAYANVDGIFLRTIQNGDTKMLSAPGDYLDRSFGLVR